MNATLVFEAAYDVMVTSGHDFGGGFAIGLSRYAAKLAEKLQVSKEQAEKCLRALHKHGYIEVFREDASSEFYASYSQKAINLMNN